MSALTIPVLFGSVRHDRAGLRACRWIMEAISDRGHTPVLVDAAAIGLPLLDRMYKEFAPGTAPAPLDDLAALYAEADGFLVVSGEYNHAAPAALKNLLDTSSRTISGGRRASLAIRPASSAGCARPCNCA